MTVWMFSLICVAMPPTECRLADMVVFPRIVQNSKEECIKQGQSFLVHMKLPEDKWAVICMDGVVKTN